MIQILPDLPPIVSVYVLPLCFVWCVYMLVRRVRARRWLAALEAAKRAGLGEPPSLHPVIDPDICIGCGTCVKACPESGVLGLIHRKAVLINPSNCIGHGACKYACPVDGISLVLGTETRGVEIPQVGSDFQTNVPGVFVAGELGGMGLIRNGIEQGRQAVDNIRQLAGIGRGRNLDLVIVGAGPAGFAASLAAMKHKLRFVTVEQETLGGTVAHYPRGKIVMTAPVDLPLHGKVMLRETSKEALLAFWEDVERRTGVQINYNEQVEKIARTEGGFFETKTSRGSYVSRAVLLAIGRRGTPRKLGVPGEESTKVVYRLVDPAQYRGKGVLVVGGGDSALEAVLALSQEPGTKVALSYRGKAFQRAKPKNRERIEAARAEGQLSVLLESEVLEIGETHVQLRMKSQRVRCAADTVIVCAGGILPTDFLRSIGIEIEMKYGTV